MFYKTSIKNKLIFVYVSITAIVLAFALTIIMRDNIEATKVDVVSGLSVVGEIVADRCAASLVFSDVGSANNILKSLRSHDAVVYACIRTVDNQLFTSHSFDEDEDFQCDEYNIKSNVAITNNYIDIYKLIVLEDESIGMVQIKASINTLTDKTVKIIEISLLTFSSLMLIASLVSRRLMSHITEPITQLKEIAQKVTKNQDYSLRMHKNSGDELGVLVESFNDMLSQIQRRDKDLLDEKDKAESYAISSQAYAKQTEKINLKLENEIRERARVEKELQDLNETLEEKVQERTVELENLNKEIGDIARNAGMAEVASGVLHNVGNVLNSVNVSVSIMREKIQNSKSENLSKVVLMMDDHKNDIGKYLVEDEKGKHIPEFLALLSMHLDEEKESFIKELNELADNVDHIKNVISMQQSYAGSFGVREKVCVSGLVEDALKINAQGMQQHGIEVIKKYTRPLFLYVDKHKVLQVIINLISNARYALIDSENKKKQLFILINKQNRFIEISVRDTGVGIDKNDITHIFEYGFKKRRGGHGYGLHHSALVVEELGGKISVSSEGLGKGAEFILSIPSGEGDEV